jgi:hypothetical protein
MDGALLEGGAAAPVAVRVHRTGLSRAECPEVACVRARAERQGSAAVVLGVMGLRPYVWIMVRLGAIVLNVSDTASLDERRKEGS